MEREIERMVRMLEKTFDGYPWYGNSVQATLRAVDDEKISATHGPTHSMVELILHMVAWRTYVMRRLLGDSTYKITDETNFPEPTTWRDALDKLVTSQRDLIEVIKKFPEEKLDDPVPEGEHKYTFYTLIHGIIQHDIYHLGQIAYINKSFMKHKDE